MSKKNRSGAQKRRARLSRTEPPPEQPPKFGPPALAVRETPRVAEVEWTQPEIDKVFEQTVRSLLQVPANQPEDLSALLVIDERLDERLLARSTKWMHLGPRGGLSDAQRMLRWLRLHPDGLQDVLHRSRWYTPLDASCQGSSIRRSKSGALQAWRALSIVLCAFPCERTCVCVRHVARA